MLQRNFRRKLILLCLIVGLIFGNIGGSSAFLQTLGDFLSLGANTVREIQEAIGLAGAEVASTLNTLEGTILDLMDELEDKYQDNLNITIDSLDSATRNKLLELESLMLSVNDVLKDDIRFISDEARALLEDATLEIRQLSSDVKEDLQDVIIVAGETGAFLITRTTETLMTVGSLVFLALGVIIFVWLLFRSGRNLSGFSAVLAYGMVIGYIGVFGALLLVPQFRAFVISSTGIGLQDRLETITEQPNVFSITPTEIIVSETDEIDIWGNSLLPNGEQPVITIGERSVPFTASDDRIVVDVSGLQAAGETTTISTNMTFERASEIATILTNPTVTRDLLERADTPILTSDTTTQINPSRVYMDRRLWDDMGIDLGIDLNIGESELIEIPDIREIIPLIPEGASVLKLSYENFDDVTAIVRVTVPEPELTPPDLRITNFSLSPFSPIEDDNVQASITIRNMGQEDATNFNIMWKPTGATNSSRSQNISRLAGGATQTFTFNFPYPNPGSFTSVVEVDTLNRVAESNEGNNSQTRSITVRERPPRRAEVTVRFTSVAIIDDAENGEGELVLDFNVNGQTARYPNSGTKGINSGNSYTVNRTVTVTLQEGENLNIFVNGREEDSGFNGGDDDMGRVSISFTSGQNWGEGARNSQSNCPDGCYQIFYTISVNDLP